ncbi:MAG: hypothetical protein WDO73_32445 [Ignavibacteriota bacterium]
MGPQMGKSGSLHAWISDIRTSMGLRKKKPAPVAVDPVAGDLAKLQKERDLTKRIALCEQFLQKHSARKMSAPKWKICWPLPGRNGV